MISRRNNPLSKATVCNVNQNWWCTGDDGIVGDDDKDDSDVGNN